MLARPRAGCPAACARRPVGTATIYDIAALAGVNPSTVSRALSKPGRISAKTEKAIQDAAKQLNYRANPMARALPTGRSRTLGLIIADITNPMYFDVLRGAERAAALSGYTLVIAESQESGEREAATVERIAPSVDGLILGTTRLTDAQIAALAETKPLVVINRRVEDAADVEAIVPQLGPGIRQALTHLAGLGHTSVVYLSGPDRSWMSAARGEALAAEAREPGVAVVQIGPGAPTLQGGRDALDAVLASGASAVDRLQRPHGHRAAARRAGARPADPRPAQHRRVRRHLRLRLHVAAADHGPHAAGAHGRARRPEDPRPPRRGPAGRRAGRTRRTQPTVAAGHRAGRARLDRSGGELSSSNSLRGEHNITSGEHNMTTSMTKHALVVRGGWDGHQPVETTDSFVPFLTEHGYDVRVEDETTVYTDDRVHGGRRPSSCRPTR